MEEKIMYQVSTLQALSMGYSRKVITVGELKTIFHLLVSLIKNPRLFDDILAYVHNFS